MRKMTTQINAGNAPDSRNRDRWFNVYPFGRMMIIGEVPRKRAFTDKEFAEIIWNMGTSYIKQQKTMSLLHELSKFSPNLLKYETNKHIANIYNTSMAKAFGLIRRSTDNSTGDVLSYGERREALEEDDLNADQQDFVNENNQQKRKQK